MDPQITANPLISGQLSDRGQGPSASEKDALGDWLGTLEAVEGKSAGTLAAYGRNVQRMLDDLGDPMSEKTNSLTWS